MSQDKRTSDVDAIVELWKIYPSLTTEKDKRSLKRQIAMIRGTSYYQVLEERLSELEKKVQRLSIKEGLGR